ncbi:carboxypeptidase D, partial [Striga asiatica]
MILSLIFLSLNLSTLFHSAIARGSAHHRSKNSGYIESTYGRPRRRLNSQTEFKMSEEVYIEKLEKLAQGYMSNTDLEREMKEFNNRCRNISRLYSMVHTELLVTTKKFQMLAFLYVRFGGSKIGIAEISIGKSALGVPLWALEISDLPGKIEAEPAFKFIGNVHGDEPVGRELLLLLANWLCNNYMKDPLVTLIVDNVHLHILPTMNPDGFSLRRRGNANNIDLNRDFPDQGALVANYPWDGTEDKKRYYYGCPDDQTFRFLASLYSRSHYNMSLSQEFPGGITNGAYPIYGGMQDWNYINSGCFELTLEISDDKWPNATELPTLWEYNRMSMLNLVASLVKTGLHGQISSSDNGRPLPASIAIRGINSTVAATTKFADYHRLLAPGGKYEVIATMPGYRPKSACVVLGQSAITVDFVLDPETNSEGSKPLEDSGCYFDNTFGVQVMDFMPVPRLEIPRRVRSNHLNQKQTTPVSKRA